VPAAARGSLEKAAQVPTVVAAPSSTPATSVPPVTPVATPNPAASAPLATQLARPIFSLAAAGTGQHVMTVSVTPDNLGPVTLRAHVGADGVRVELFAPNDIGRDAIRAIIPELRRDLAGAGLGGNLTLSSQNQPSAGSDHSAAGQAGGRGDRDGTTHPAADGTRGGANDIPPTESDSRQRAFGSASTIDVLA
jgi:flagellar hook-length control protein FliK